jgi:hypothetical protein
LGSPKLSADFCGRCPPYGVVVSLLVDIAFAYEQARLCDVKKRHRDIYLEKIERDFLEVSEESHQAQRLESSDEIMTRISLTLNSSFILKKNLEYISLMRK